MVAGRWKVPRRGSLWVASALLLTLLPLGCSSGGGAAADASSSDAADDAAPDSAADDASDAAADGARGGTGGTVRGGSGGRGGTGGLGEAGGTAPDTAPGEGPPVPTPGHDTCPTAQAIPLTAPRVEVATTTRGAGHHLDLGCAAGGGDVFFSFRLTARSLVYADTFGATFNTILAFTDACPGTDADGGAPAGSVPACNDDACGTQQSQAVALLPPGTHYLVLSGAAGESGDVTLHLEHAPVGGGAVSALGAGTASSSGTTSGNGQLALCEAGGPEDSYWWTSCQGFNGGPFMASTCAGTAYDTMLALQVPRVNALVCNDDACKLQASITTNLAPGAGLHVLSVDGFTTRQAGPYMLTTTRP